MDCRRFIQECCTSKKKHTHTRTADCSYWMPAHQNNQMSLGTKHCDCKSSQTVKLKPFFFFFLVQFNSTNLSVSLSFSLIFGVFCCCCSPLNRFKICHHHSALCYNLHIIFLSTVWLKIHHFASVVYCKSGHKMHTWSATDALYIYMQPWNPNQT